MSSEKMVPMDVIRELSRGSFEHLSVRLDGAIEENRHMFAGKREVDLARLATFPARVIVGTADGEYFSARFEDIEGRIKLELPERLDVPVLDKSNTKELTRQYSLGAVDAILAGNQAESRERLAALVKLQESAEEKVESLTSAVFNHVNDRSRFWRDVYAGQKEAIEEQMRGFVDTLAENKIDPKYYPLYDGTIPEEKFESYRDAISMDLAIVSERLEKIHSGAESAYIPYAEAVANIVRTPDEDDVLKQFDAFSEDYFHDLHALREYVAFGLKNEECVMCLGQIHDAIAESLTDYEVAGSFVKMMASQFVEAK